MNDLLFIALLIALLYYFFIYLPQQKKNNLNPDPDYKPFTHPKSTKIDPDPKEVKFPSNETVYECPGALTIEDKQELEKTLDYLMKGMDELSQDLDKY